MSDPKPLSRRDRNLADIRDRATRAAEQIVQDQGGSALNARGLAASLNISVGSLYNAFGDLNGVIAAVNRRCANRLADQLKHAVETAAPTRQARVTALGEAYFDFAISERRNWWLLFQRDVDLEADDDARALQEELLEMLIRAGDGDPSSDQHRQFFLLLWASVHGLVSLAVRPTIATIQIDVARDYIRELVRAGFQSFPLHND